MATIVINASIHTRISRNRPARFSGRLEFLAIDPRLIRIQTPTSLGELPRYLNQMFYTWLQRHPEFTVRATLPVVENGNMVVLHVCFD